MLLVQTIVQAVSSSFTGVAVTLAVLYFIGRRAKAAETVPATETEAEPEGVTFMGPPVSESIYEQMPGGHWVRTDVVDPSFRDAIRAALRSYKGNAFCAPEIRRHVAHYVAAERIARDLGCRGLWGDEGGSPCPR